MNSKIRHDIVKQNFDGFVTMRYISSNALFLYFYRSMIILNNCTEIER